MTLQQAMRLVPKIEIIDNGSRIIGILKVNQTKQEPFQHPRLPRKSNSTVHPPRTRQH